LQILLWKRMNLFKMVGGFWFIVSGLSTTAKNHQPRTKN
jgi:hypothetical protein